MKTHMRFLLMFAASVRWADGAVFVESASLRDYVITLRDEAIDDTDPNSYQAPTLQERMDFATMAGHLSAGNLVAADAIAGGLGYEVVDFTDTVTNSGYYLLREATVDGEVTKGWGSYFFNPNGTAPVLLQAPHILHDTHSYDVTAVAFANSGAMAMMFNGAHRDKGGPDAADVAHLSSSIFQTVHETWTTDASVQAWQIHGFSLDNHPSIPAGTDVVLSNGDGSVSQETIILDAAFEAVSFIGDAQSISHAYNTLGLNDPDNILVNGNVDGADMSGLGGTTNVQGIHTRSLGGIFVHIELEQSIRLDGTLAEDLANRETAGLVIADAIAQIPEPSSVTLVFGASLLLLARRRSFCI